MMKLHKLFFIVFGFLILTSCENYTKEYYDDGTLKSSVIINKSGNKQGKYEEFYKNGSIKEISYFQNGILIDSSSYYSDNNELTAIRYYFQKKITQKEFSGDTISVGEIHQGLKVGDWKYYVDNSLVEIRSFTIKQTPSGVVTSLNQKKWFNSKGELDSIKSQYYHIDFPNPIIANKEYLLSIKFNIPNSRGEFTLGKDRYDFLMLNEDFDSNFSYPEGTKVDTIVNIERNNFIFPHKFTKVGKQNFRAVINSHFFTVTRDSTEIDIGEVLIDEEILVKEENDASKKQRT